MNNMKVFLGQGKPSKRIDMFFKEMRINWQIMIIGLPGILFLFVFSYLPMFGIILAFKNYYPGKGFFGSPWVGFDNFKFFFTSQTAFRVTRNTVGLNFAFIISELLISMIFALILFELSKKATRIYQTALFFPYFTSWVVVSFILYAFLNPDFGVANKVLVLFGLEPVFWYSEATYWPIIMVVCYVWKWAGYGSLIYYTGLIGIETTLYEAAEIDGATKLQQIWHISVPMLSPLIIILLMTKIGQIMRADFGMFFFLPRNVGALFPTTDVIDTYVYRSIRVNGDLGMGAAAGLYQSVMGLAIVLISNFAIRKINSENALF